jgi:hypothetical protein
MKGVPVLFSLALLLLGPPPPAMPPQTTVELRVTSVDEGEAKLLEQTLLRQLGDRLLEDGYRVVPVGRAASVRVWIHIDAAGATIDTRGDSHRVEAVAGGDPELVGLEIQQLTSALVDEVQPSEVEPLPAIVLDLSGESNDPELRERLQSGLLERGYALTRKPDADDRRLCVASEASGASKVAVVGGVASCEFESAVVRVSTGPTLEVGRELLLDRASTSLAAWRSAEVEAETEVELPSASIDRVEPVVSAAEPEPRRDLDESPDPRRGSVTVAAQAGILGRAGGPPDAIVGLDLRVGRQRGLGGALELKVVPSKAEALRVIETLPTARLDWRIALRERGLVALGVFGGVHLHSYVQAGPTGERATKIGPSVGAKAGVGWLGRRGALLFGNLRAGWSGGRWVHLHDGVASWRRSGLMIGLELGVGWDFAWRRSR